jgi:septum site-determining protein MinC
VSVAVDYEQAGELKIGQVGIANLRVRTLDVAKLVDEMRDRVQRAPKLFARAAVVIDFGGLSRTPDVGTARALLDGLRQAGVLPVALAYGTTETERLSEALGLPLLAKFRAQYERDDGVAAAAPAPAPAPAARREPAPPRRDEPAAKPAAAPSANAAPPSPGVIQSAPVRSGQQVYADNRDLTVLSSVGAGAEVIADGSVHIYGPLRGRALAGAQGNAKARIFCREFDAELVAIAGHYKVLEDIPQELRGKAVQIWLEDEQLKIAALD